MSSKSALNLFLIVMVVGCLSPAQAILKPIRLFNVEKFPHALPGDPFQQLPQTKVSGVLTYDYMKSFNPQQQAIVMRTLGKKPGITTYILSPAAFLNPNESIFDAHRSPDGRFIAFKFGGQVEFDSRYRLFALDTRTDTIVQITQREIGYEHFYWSPDGRYLAYVQGGNLLGEATSRDKSLLKLRVWDSQTGTDHIVVHDNFVAKSFTWAGQHELYYSVPKPVKGPHPMRPSLYRYLFEANHSKLILEDCYRPVISPDGKKVAYFGSEKIDPPSRLGDHWYRQADGMALRFSNLDGTDTKTLKTEIGNYPTLMWEADSQSLLDLKQTTESPQATYSIARWDSAGHRNIITQLQVRDYKWHGPSDWFSNFFILGLNSPDNQLLIVTENIRGEKEDAVTLDAERTIQAVDLTTGQTTALGRTHLALSFDWSH